MSPRSALNGLAILREATVLKSRPNRGPTKGRAVASPRRTGKPGPAETEVSEARAFWVSSSWTVRAGIPVAGARSGIFELPPFDEWTRTLVTTQIPFDPNKERTEG
jgi:hypothetical protein